MKENHFDFVEQFYKKEELVTIAVFDNSYLYCLDKKFDQKCCKHRCVNEVRLLPFNTTWDQKRKRTFFCSKCSQLKVEKSFLCSY